MTYEAVITWHSVLDPNRQLVSVYVIDDKGKDHSIARPEMLFNHNNTDQLHIYIDFWETRGYRFSVETRPYYR